MTPTWGWLALIALQASSGPAVLYQWWTICRVWSSTWRRVTIRRNWANHAWMLLIVHSSLFTRLWSPWHLVQWRICQWHTFFFPVIQWNLQQQSHKSRCVGTVFMNSVLVMSGWMMINDDSSWLFSKIQIQSDTVKLQVTKLSWVIWFSNLR